MAIVARVAIALRRRTALTGSAVILALAPAAFAVRLGPCPETPRAERHYILSARVRPLLFWIRRDNVGAGQITWTNGADGRLGLELLIGSDPERVPMRINRWGYIGEFRDGDVVNVIGVMTQSDEGTIEEARQKEENREKHGNTYRALRTRIQDGAASTEIFYTQFPQTVTYRALDEVREKIDGGAGRLRNAAVPENADHGFLQAVASLVRESVAVYRRHGLPVPQLSRVYSYASLVYHVTMQSSKVHPRFLLDGMPHSILESEFEVNNRATRKTSRFRMWYGTGHPIAETPVRVVFRPHWWLEAELNLQGWPACGPAE